jgi:hypothetical protein
MTTKRFAGTIAAAFVVSQILAVLVHGFILKADYAPFYGTLLRPMANEGAWRMLLLPLAHLLFVSALVWVYSRVAFEGSHPKRGVKLGLFGWIIGQAPFWMLWYAEQPWPDSLVGKQLTLELASSLIIGLTIAAIAGTQQRSAV